MILFSSVMGTNLLPLLMKRGKSKLHPSIKLGVFMIFPIDGQKANHYIPAISEKASLSFSPEQNEKLLRLFEFLKNLSGTTYHRFLKDLVEKCESNGDIPSYLSNIKCLDLSHCELQILPDEIEALSSLEQLILINNRLTQLPRSLISLSYLRDVQIQNNLFTAVPSAICSIAESRIHENKVFNLYLRENPIPTIPSKIKAVVRSMPRFNTIYVV